MYCVVDTNDNKEHVYRRLQDGLSPEPSLGLGCVVCAGSSVMECAVQGHSQCIE